MSKYIELGKAIEVCDWYEHEYSECEDYIRTIAEDIRHLPAADVVEVVRCRDCVMWDGSFTLNGQKKCLNMTFCTDGDFYCGWGTRNE